MVDVREWKERERGVREWKEREREKREKDNGKRDRVRIEYSFQQTHTTCCDKISGFAYIRPLTNLYYYAYQK